MNAPRDEAYFEAGGLGHTPMNLHSPTDRPTGERKKSLAQAHRSNL